MYVRMYVCMSVLCVYVYARMYVSMCVCMYVSTYVCLSGIYMCVCVRMYFINMHVCTYVGSM